MRLIRLLCIALLVAASRSAAQDGLEAPHTYPVPDWPIAAGSRVRIRSAILSDLRDRYTLLGFRYSTGSVVSATADTLTFRADGDSADATAIIAFRMRSARKFAARSGIFRSMPLEAPIVPGRGGFAKRARGDGLVRNRDSIKMNLAL